MEIHDKHHHATFRLLIGILALVVIGVAIYLIISYTTVQSALQTAPVASSTPTQTVGTATSSPVVKSQPTTPTTPVTTNPAPTSGEVVITNADMNTTVHVAKGQKFVVQLGGGLHWTVQFDPASAVTQLEGSSTDGVQGVYRADQAGTISLSASGAPICKPDQACPMFMAVFNATISVQ